MGLRKLERPCLLVLAIMVVFVLVYLFHALQENGVSQSSLSLNEGWSIQFKGATSDSVATLEYIFPEKILMGDTIVLTNRLPANLPPRFVLRFRTYHSVVEVLVGGEKIYERGLDDYKANRMVGSGYHYVYLSPDDGGKDILVRLIAAETDGFNTFSSFDIIPDESANTDHFARNLVSLIIGLFLVLFGVLSILISVAVSFFRKPYFRILMIGFLSFALGCWTLCYTKLIQVFSYNFSFNTSLEYISLYFAPFPLCELLIDMRKGQISNWKWRTLIGFALCDAAFLLVTSILHFTNIAHYPHTLLFFHIYVLVGFLFIIFSGILYSKSMDLSGKILTAGLVIFGAVALVDLLRYNVYKYLSIESSLREATFIPIGMLVFVLMLVISYLVYQYRLVAERAERDVLATMVYKDNLTGLYNRAKCQQIFDILDRSKCDFSIISMDLNGLKLVNDRYGHGTGDKLLKAFAKVFKEAFQDVGTAIRMGGDEYVAIVREEHIPEIDEALHRLKVLERTFDGSLPVPLEAAYGVAFRSEIFKGNSEIVYKMADDRMYTMKSSMKSDLVRK